MNKIDKIITHDGAFHLDEVFAIALIKKFWQQDINIIRTRDNNIIESAKNDDDVVVLDVGREYEPEYLYFDHHQKTFDEVWSAKDYNLKQDVLLSSTGIVFNYLNANGAFSDYGLSDKSVDFIRDHYIIKVDAEDNGFELFEELSFINKFNTNGSLKESQFNKALYMMEFYLSNIIDRAVEYEIVFEQTRKAVEFKKIVHTKSGDMHVVCAKKGQRPDLDIALSLDKDIDFFIKQRNKDEYSVVTAPLGVGQIFSQKNTVPKSISNDFEKGNDLSYISDVPVNFIHRDGFISIIKGTQENALDYIKNIKNYEYNLKLKPDLKV